MKRTLRVKNCLYFDVELFLELMSKKISNVIDWMFVPFLSLISISSYVVQGTKETGNIYSYSRIEFIK